CLVCLLRLWPADRYTSTPGVTTPGVDFGLVEKSTPGVVSRSVGARALTRPSRVPGTQSPDTGTPLHVRHASPLRAPTEDDRRDPATAHPAGAGSERTRAGISSRRHSPGRGYRLRPARRQSRVARRSDGGARHRSAGTA